MPIQIAIVDDNPDLIQSIQLSLSLFEELEIIMTASHGKDCCEKLLEIKRKPQVVLMDIDMPVMNGIEATSLIHEMYPAIKVVMLTVFDDDKKIFDAVQAGANGYLLKDAKPGRIMAAIEDALEGGVPMSPLVASKTLELLLNYAPSAKDLKSPEDYKLSERETQVLKLLSSGKNYHLIAEMLFISPKTVRGHIERIYGKLHVHSKLEAVQVAQKNKWL